MANPDAPFGLKPVRHLNGSAYNGATARCYVDKDYATALFIGDPVTLDTTLANKTGIHKHMAVIKATAGDGEGILGVIVSFDPIRTDLSKNYLPASTGGYVNVCIDPDVIYQIRDDGAATPTEAMTGQNANLIFTHSGSTTTGLSGVELDMNSDGPAADESNQLFILQAADVENNDLGTHAVWEVLINTHVLRNAGSGGLGVTAS